MHRFRDFCHSISDSRTYPVLGAYSPRLGSRRSYCPDRSSYIRRARLIVPQGRRHLCLPEGGLRRMAGIPVWLGLPCYNYIRIHCSPCPGIHSLSQLFYPNGQYLEDYCHHYHYYYAHCPECIPGKIR